jgi:hypothetical protein
VDAEDKQKHVATRWAIMLEEPEELTDRLGAQVVNQKGAGPGELDPNAEALLNLFQFFIGNTDWSIIALHNAEVVLKDTAFYPIAYDFDMAGAIDARYATVDPKLNIKDVRDRLYRGYCVPEEAMRRTFALFQEKKDAIYALYSKDDVIGRHLKPNLARETLQYFDEFYKIIGDPRQAKRHITDMCQKG